MNAEQFEAEANAGLEVMVTHELSRTHWGMVTGACLVAAAQPEISLLARRCLLEAAARMLNESGFESETMRLLTKGMERE